MATVASINLVFNAKNNTKNVFNTLNKGVATTQKEAEKASQSFFKLDKTIARVGASSAPRLQQSIVATRNVFQKLFDVALGGASALSQELLNLTGSAISLAKTIAKISDEFSKGRSYLDGESFASLLQQQITEAASETVSFQTALTKTQGAITRIVKDSKDGFGSTTKEIGEAEAETERLSKSVSKSLPAAFQRVSVSATKATESTSGVVSNIAKSARQAADGIVSQTARSFPEAAASIQTGLNSIDNVAGKLRQSFGGIGDAFKRGLAGVLPTLGQTLDVFDKVQSKAVEIPQQVGGGLAALGGALRLAAGYDEALATLDSLKKAAGGFAESIGKVSQQIFFFQSAFESVSQIAVSSPFKLLIGQQVELRQQLLETQSTLVATNRIVSKATGEQLNLPSDLGGDPAQAITALTGATQAAIDQLRKDSLDLVGVTSRELAEVFNITTTGLASVGIETENILKDAADLTIKFSAALGTIGLPLFQARQEITSILNGTIDSNSALAKTLNITNDQVKKYKEQGTLIDKLNQKLEAFQSGNAIAAKSLGGVTSNLQEILEIVALQAGKPLLDPLLEDLNKLFNFLSSRQNEFVRFLEPVIEDIGRIRENISSAFANIGQTIGASLAKVPVGIINAFANFIKQVSIALVDAVNILKPFIGLLDPLLNIFSNLNNSFGQTVIRLIALGKIIQLVTSGLNLLVNLVPGLGELRFVLQSGTKGIVSQFSNLLNTLPPVTALLTTVGLNFEKLATTFPAVQEGLSNALGGLKFLTPAIIKLTPKLSALLVFISGLPKALKNLADNFLKAIPKIQAFIAKSQVAGNVIAALAAKITAALLAIKTAAANFGLQSVTDNLDDLIGSLQVISATQGREGVAELAQSFDIFSKKAGKGLQAVSDQTEKLSRSAFSKFAKSASASALKAATKFGLWAIAIGTAGIALSEFVRRRKDAGDEIRKFSSELTAQADRISAIGDNLNETADGVDEVGGAFSNNGKLAEDFVDKLILIERNFDPSNLKFDTIGDTFESTFQRIAAFSVRAFSLVLKTARFVELQIQKLAIQAQNLIEKLPGAQTEAERLRNEQIETLEAQGVEVPEYINVFGQEIDRQAIEAARERAQAIGGFRGILQQDALFAEELRKARDEAREKNIEIARQREDLGISEVPSTLKASKIDEELKGVFSGEDLNFETKAEESVREIITAIEQEDLPGKAAAIAQEYTENLLPQDQEITAAGARISEALSSLGGTGADRIGSLNTALSELSALGDKSLIDPSAIQAAQAEIEAFKKSTIGSDGALLDASEGGAEAYGEALEKLRNQLNLTLAQERNVSLELEADNINRQIGQIDDYIRRLQEFGAASPEKDEAIRQLFRTKEQLNAALAEIQTLQENVDILPDPVTIFANAVQSAEKVLQKETARVTLNQQNQIAKIEEDFTKRKLNNEIVSTLDKEKELAAINRQAAEEELASTEEEVAKLIKTRDQLSEFDLERASEANSQLIQLETRLAQQRIKLFETTVAEQSKLRQVAERDIDQALLVARNATTEQTQNLKAQQQEYEAINQLIDTQSQLLSENNKLVDAQANAAVSGLEFLAQTARGQRRQKEFAEAAATVRLQAVQEQIKFEQISLKLEQQKTQLALEREAVSARIATLEAEADVATAQAELEKTLLPGSEATAAERRAAAIGLRSARLQLQAAERGESLLQQQLEQQPLIAKFQTEAAAAQQENRLSEAERSRVAAIASPAQRRRAERELQNREIGRIAERIGLDPNSFDGVTGFFREIRNANDLDLRDRGLASGSGPQFADTLEAFVPGLSDFTGDARVQALSLAARRVVQAGELPDGTNIPSTASSGQRFQLQTSQPAILQQALAPVQSTLGIAANGIGKAAEGFNSLIGELRAIASKPTFNLTVTANGQTAQATGAATKAPADIGQVLAAAKRFAANDLF